MAITDVITTAARGSRVVDAGWEALLMLRRSGTPSNDADRGVRSQADGDNN
jgi:hypothetical protein